MRTRDGAIVYVGMAGERRGQGLRGRLSIYRRGKGAVSGFGEAALDRALADAGFIEMHLAAVLQGRSARTSEWAQDAIRWFDIETRWATCATKADALTLEGLVVEILMPHGIWNRVASRVPLTSRSDGDTDLAGENELTVAKLSGELGIEDGGKTVRRVLRTGFPDHVKAARWDPLTEDQAAYVRMVLSS